MFNDSLEQTMPDEACTPSAKKLTNKIPNPPTDGLGSSIAEVLDSEYRGVSLYAVAMLVLVIAMLWTGVSVVEQIQNYHQKYGELQTLKKQFRQLQMEHQRMLIEQQTFSATPQVMNRAVAELNMFYPNITDRMIIHDNTVSVLHADTVPATSSSAHLDTDSAQSTEATIDPETQH